MVMICERCRKETNVSTMSMFNTDTICMECEKKEREHPAYTAAQDAERNAVIAGNYNFPGIGKPEGL
jgi:hypothetical protein